MKIKKTSILILSIAALGIGYYITRAGQWGNWDSFGFTWIGNNLMEGVEQGDPVIGMIDLDITRGEGKYGLQVVGDGASRNIVGSAWIGIGSQDDKFNDFANQNDLPSLGWIHFNQPFDQAKLKALLASNCFGAGDCHGARWNEKPGAVKTEPDTFEGYLSGWARMEIGPNGDTTPYSDVWVHFKSPNDPNNYSCNEGGHHYYVCMDTEGKLEGYAWSAGTDANFVGNNPGLGWIKFSRQTAGFVGVRPATNQFCATLLDTESDGVGCKNDSNFKGEFKFKAYQTRITLNPNNPANSFQWMCKDNEDPKTGERATCVYTDPGTYTPKLKVYDESSRKWIECTSQISVKVTTDSSCSVSTKDETTAQGELVEAEINRQCLTGGEVKWTITGGIGLSQQADSATFKPSGASNIRISAQIMKDSKTYNCRSADVRVTETIKWR